MIVVVREHFNFLESFQKQLQSGAGTEQAGSESSVSVVLQFCPMIHLVG